MIGTVIALALLRAFGQRLAALVQGDIDALDA
jgi:hypothetical protein